MLSKKHGWMKILPVVLCLLLALNTVGMLAQEVTEEPAPAEATATPLPTLTPTFTPTNTPEPTATPLPTSTPEPSATPLPTNTPTAEATDEVTPEVTPEVTEESTPEVTAEPTSEVTPEATEESTPEVTPEITAEVTETVEPVTPQPTQQSAILAPVLAAPDLRSPDNGSTISSLRPRLRWNRVQGAQRYRVDLATDAGFTSPLLTDYENRGTTLSLSTRVLPQELLQGTYFWRVQTQDNQDQWGAESSVFQFTVGLPRKPNDGTFTTNERITLQWTRAKDASRYRLLVDDHSDFSSPVVEYITTSNRNTRYKPSRNNPLPVGNLYWRVDVEINNLWVVAPVVFDLTITPKPLSAPKQFTPANRLETNDTTPTFTWEAVVDPLSQPVTYQLQIATNGSFRDIVIDTTTAATNFTPGAAMAEGRYFWRVRTLNYLGAPGRWSRSSIFTVDTTPPQPPVLVTPRDGSTVDRSRVTFKWRSSRTAVQYYLRWGTTNPPVGSGVDNGRRTSYKLTDPLLADIYYWQVQAVDRAGNISAWSAPFSFTAESPADAVPVLNRFTTDTPELTWTPISWAQGYELQIALDTDFNGPVYLINTLAANELAHVVQQSLPDGIYYWRIRAKVDATTWGNWSTTGTFLIQQ